MTSPRLTAEQARRVEQALPRVAALARALAPVVKHLAVEELESAGYDGLIEAALRYDPAVDVPFTAYAHFRVRGAMIDAARRAEPLLRRRTRAIVALQATQALLEQQPTADVVDPRGLRERVAAAADLVAQATAAVLLSKRGPADPEELVTQDVGTEERLLRREEREVLDRLLAASNDAERRLIKALYFEGLTMQEYADALGVDKSTVSRHHARLLGRLSAEMRAAMGGGR